MHSSVRPARSAVLAAALSLIASSAFAQVRITEFMYGGGTGGEGEFIEFTNVGATPVDMTGWSYDDSRRLPGGVDLSAFGLVLPGESAVLTESGAAAFRSAWGLCDGAKLIGGLAQNLGRSDEINLYDAGGGLVDRLTYNDQATAGDPAKAPRTDQRSAWVPASALGNNTAIDWVLSTPGDGEGSWATAGGTAGSPGRSSRATVAYNPCGAPPAGHPTIGVAATTTARLTLPGSGSGALSAVLDDPTDPARASGIDFTVGDGETAAAALAVTASSSNPAVVPDAGLSLEGSGATRNLKISPVAPGRAIITVTVNDGDGHSTGYHLLYAASAASVTPVTSRFHTGACDASAAIAMGAGHMFVANDEDQSIRLYELGNSGWYHNAFDMTAMLGLTDLSGGAPREVDIEAAVRSGNRIYWLGSHSNSSGGALRPNRYRLFATDVSGSGAAATLAYVGRYDGLRDDLIAWDETNGHGQGAGALGLAASAAAGVIPEAPDGSGFNIEALAMAPDGTTAYLGFRAPLMTTASRDRALVVPVANFAALIGGAGPASFGAPINLDLGGRAIREMTRSANGEYLILAGPTASAGGFALYVWDGNAATAPQRLTTDLSFDVNGGSFEGIAGVPDSLAPGTQVRLIVDNGDSVWHGGLTPCKEDGSAAQKKFRSELVTLGYANGVDEQVQTLVPDPAGGGAGDGNGDGIPDAGQAHVVSLPGAIGGGRYVTIAAEPGDNGGAALPLVEVEAVPVPGSTPANLELPLGAFRFRVLNLPAGGTANLAIYVPGDLAVDGYYKQDVNGTWRNAAVSFSMVGDKRRFLVPLRDGGELDADLMENGQVLDPGGPGLLAAAQVTAVPALSGWAMLLLVAAAGGFGAGTLRRR